MVACNKCRPRLLSVVYVRYQQHQQKQQAQHSATFARVTQASLDQIVFCIQIQIVAYAIEYLKQGDYDTLFKMISRRRFNKSKERE